MEPWLQTDSFVPSPIHVKQFTKIYRLYLQKKKVWAYVYGLGCSSFFKPTLLILSMKVRIWIHGMDLNCAVLNIIQDTGRLLQRVTPALYGFIQAVTLTATSSSVPTAVVSAILSACLIQRCIQNTYGIITV